VKPPSDPMGFEIGLGQPSRYRALSNCLTDVFPSDRGLGQGTNRPVGPRCGKLGRRVTRKPQNFMPLFGGKTSAAARSARCPAVPRNAVVRSDRPSVSPTSGPARGSARYPMCSCPTPRAKPPARAPQAKSPCGPVVASGAGSTARPGSAESCSHSICASYRRGYLTSTFPWGRTFGTLH
jgi:hypothetical protein